MSKLIPSLKTLYNFCLNTQKECNIEEYKIFEDKVVHVVRWWGIMYVEVTGRDSRW
jgi:hypothetical protein